MDDELELYEWGREQFTLVADGADITLTRAQLWRIVLRGNHLLAETEDWTR